MIRLDDLIEKARSYLPQDANFDLLTKAYVYSAKLHRDRFFHSGTPVLQHDLEVSHILAEMRMDLTTLVAGLLHDVLEDGLAAPEELKTMMGPQVSALVAALSQLTRASYHSSEESRANHMRQMILSSTQDIRVILILLADRLQLMRSLGQLKEGERKHVARESQTIYAPIAGRLGIHSIKAELEDIAFSQLEPQAYAELKQQVESRVAESAGRMKEIDQELAGLLSANQLHGEILGRTKHLFSIHNKLKANMVSLDRLYDLLAFRVILDTNEECYRVLGMIHAAYTPLPGRFKDYIALAKENGYQSLHTTVFGAKGDVFEVQIRTREMHRQAELGIAAHFIYKEGQGGDQAELANLAWFRRLLENLDAGQDPSETMELVVRDLEPEHYFIFTPTGEVIKLPPKATPIDFAYSVHTEVGNHCIGAKMDGRMIPIRTPLKNGSVVEILTSSRQAPHKDWLKFARTSKALSRIRSYLRHQEESEAAVRGKERVAREARRFGKKLEELVAAPEFVEWIHRHNYPTVEEFYYAEGFGRVNIGEVLEKLYPEGGKTRGATSKKVQNRAGEAEKRVRVAGLDNVMVRFAQCCSPVEGDPVVGIITRGRGVSIHRADCPNPKLDAFALDRLVEVEWVDEAGKMKPVNLLLQSQSSPQNLEQANNLLIEGGRPVKSGAITSANGINTQQLTVMVSGAEEVQRILQQLNALEGIFAERASEPL